MRPTVVGKEDLDPAAIAKEREILAEGHPRPRASRSRSSRRWSKAACKTTMPRRCLVEQPFVKDDKRTVGQAAKDAGMKIVRFVHWELPKE